MSTNVTLGHIITSSLRNSLAHNWPSDTSDFLLGRSHHPPTPGGRCQEEKNISPSNACFVDGYFAVYKAGISQRSIVTLLAYARLTQIGEPQRALLKGSKSTNKGAEIACVPWNRWNLHCKYRCYSLSLHRFTGIKNNSKMEDKNKFHYIFSQNTLWAVTSEAWALHCIIWTRSYRSVRWTGVDIFAQAIPSVGFLISQH